jgi:hypothetical protein
MQVSGKPAPLSRISRCWLPYSHLIGEDVQQGRTSCIVIQQLRAAPMIRRGFSSHHRSSSTSSLMGLLQIEAVIIIITTLPLQYHLHARITVCLLLWSCFHKRLPFPQTLQLPHFHYSRASLVMAIKHEISSSVILLQQLLVQQAMQAADRLLWSKPLRITITTNVIIILSCRSRAWIWSFA